MQETNVLSGTAPMTASFFSPFLNIIIVGMLLTPYWDAKSGHLSVLILKHSSFPLYVLASLAITGWIIWQGPHHGAQNSMSTGLAHSMTSDCHVSFVTSGTVLLKKWFDGINISFDG